MDYLFCGDVNFFDASTAKTYNDFPTSLYYDELILQLIHGNPRRILDAGCGAGAFTFKLSERFRDADVVGCDESEDMLTAARAKLAARADMRLKLRFDYGRIQNLADDFAAIPGLGGMNFDVIVALRALHHCADCMTDAIQQLYDKLQPGGRILILDLKRTGSSSSSRFRRWITDFLYKSAVYIKGPGWFHFRQARRDLLREKEVYTSSGWAEHLAHEPQFDWRSMKTILEQIGMNILQCRSCNYKFILIVAEKRYHC
ncbi:MAG: class I SAM-dependent methyltransferase [Desulfobulbaceae bacterium]|nr:class I SAM-dependent methyltransferase [Desulfobulbaceae bacterium]